MLSMGIGVCACARHMLSMGIGVCACARHMLLMGFGVCACVHTKVLEVPDNVEKKRTVVLIRCWLQSDYVVLNQLYLTF